MGPEWDLVEYHLFCWSAGELEVVVVAGKTPGPGHGSLLLAPRGGGVRDVLFCFRVFVFPGWHRGLPCRGVQSVVWAGLLWGGGGLNVSLCRR